MGLYDTIRCKIKLPLPKDEGLLSEFGGKSIESLVSFQTKGLGRGMGSYELREDGTLWAEKYDLKYVDDPEYSKKYSELFDISTNLQKSVKYNITWVPYYVHNKTITIHEFYSPMDERYEYTTKFDYWIEYEVTFSNSIMSDVKLLKFERRDRSEREARLDALFNSMKPKPLENAIHQIFKTWRRLTRWIPTSRTIESYIINKL
jgi:hypothetical protein